MGKYLPEVEISDLFSEDWKRVVRDSINRFNCYFRLCDLGILTTILVQEGSVPFFQFSEAKVWMLTLDDHVFIRSMSA